MKFIQTLWKRMLSKETKKKLYIIIFHSDTPAGKAFDVALIIAILLSIAVVVAESIQSVNHSIGHYLLISEYIFTVIFTLEYVLRIYCSPARKRYIFSLFGLIDLVSTLPLYLWFIIGTSRYLLMIRAFRLIRVFRVFKLLSFLNEGNLLIRSLIASRRKIMVFFLFILILVFFLGTMMYMLEGPANNEMFQDIPDGIYWAIVTLTTVGYGDVTPITPAGRLLSSIVMLLGYTIVAVPTGIISASIIETRHQRHRICPRCRKEIKDDDAVYCKYCGERLN